MGGKLDGGAIRQDHARRANKGTLTALLDKSAVTEDHARGSLQDDGGEGGLELNLSAIIKDHARGSDKGTSDPVEVVVQLEVTVLSHDARGSNKNDVVGKVVAELFIRTVGPYDTGVANVSFGEDPAGGATLGTELYVIAILGYDTGGAHQHGVVGSFLTELDVLPARVHDTRRADVGTVSHKLWHGHRGRRGGSIKGRLAAGQLEVGAILCHDA